MSNVAQAPQGSQWAALVDALHALTNTMTVRTHYGAAHPAIERADAHCFATFTRVLADLSPILIAFTDGEFVICERPFPELRDRLHVLAQAMTRHDIECIVVHRGMARGECELLGSTLNLSADVPGRVREQAQTKLMHVLLRFLETRPDGKTRMRAGVDTASIVPAVRQALDGVVASIRNESDVDVEAIRALAREIRTRCANRSYALEMRSIVDGRDDLAAHAANTALVAGALSLEAQYPEEVALDVIAAALLHDIGHVLLPERIRGVPAPLLDDADVRAHWEHTALGATALLSGGCPELWVMTALEHHRGVDGRGAPAIGFHAPHELVRVVALASFLDHKRTRLPKQEIDPAAALGLAASLEDRYFGQPLVRRLIRAIGAFPPGTTVELSNRAPAIVTQVNGGDPWRPQVELLRGENAGARIELRELESVGARYALSAVRAIAPPLFVPKDIHGEAAIDPAPRVSAVVSVKPADKPRKADIDAILREMLVDDEPPKAAPSVDDLQAKLVEFLSDAPPPARPSGLVKPSPSVGGASSAPPCVGTPSKAPSAGAYSSAPPKIIEGATKPPPSSSTPTGPTSRRPPSLVGAYSSVPPRITQREEPSDGDRVSGIISRPPPRPSRPPRSVLVAVARAAELTKHADLDSRVGFLFSLIDGSSTTDEIADASGIERSEVVRLVEDLIARGLVTTKEG